MLPTVTHIVTHTTVSGSAAQSIWTWLGPLFGALAAILAASVAGGVALYGHRVSRSNSELQASIAKSTSELSAKITKDNAELQARISRDNTALTNDMSRENARLSAALSANVKLADMRQSWINNLRSDMAEFQALAVTPGLPYQEKVEFYKLMARIELSMNPRDEDYAELVRRLYKYINAEGEEEKRANDAPYVAVCQSILKREWDVLKSEIGSVSGTGAKPS